MNDLKGEKEAPIEVPHSHEQPVFLDGGIDNVYARKCDLINDCMQNEIGFGRYQLQLFILTGLGWFADNLWLQGVAVVLPQVQQELLPTRVEFATLALYVGLILGATTWGSLADLIGRRLSFNVTFLSLVHTYRITLFIASVFGVAGGGAPNFVAFASLVACMGFGIGGNLPVDGALYLEHIPQSYQWTLTLLSAWWSVGQLVASVIAWGFIGKFSCSPSAPVGECFKADNMGWRYTFFLMGSLTFLMFIGRFVIFDLQESSKYLIAKNRDEEAIQVLQHIARRNGKTITLTIEQLREIDVTAAKTIAPKTNWQVIRSSFSHLSLSHVRPLFAGKRFAVNSTITILAWGFIGLAYPLFNSFLPLYLNTRFATATDVSTGYRNYVIISVMGIPGSIIACLVVDWTRKKSTANDREDSSENEEKRLREDSKPYSFWSGLGVIGGRKLTMTISTLLTGIFLFLFTTSKNQAAVLGWSCASGLTQNAMYGVLYAYTPEVFPAPHRGTGDALASSFNRITGILAPAIKIATTSADGTGSGANSVFVSAALLTVTAFMMMFLPIETAGKAAM
ncbi:hypothetical protein AGABI1DRAFT_129759 [Agaricus bisporus var. burnettii JB137-S8]|uniref:Major facilitator superfamily (MFS) profile domain-containing protein n=1 Tax=Agaricus bisporus var. burnettii (strain JB137-S8 / ATCC MYA-4627 / FGSC 10392) TaxID=597362 RepID=K5XSN4_AGABU|nr:uncharacterized protein AGABI1DRAFT_129759 [Agaricus bisporus var. burnettii JB137-S8]EKM77975.1 hypothetical protein AGABI1DRAFT_129759 [Agaricus bisporus var. burnettii JB137-S8]